MRCIKYIPYRGDEFTYGINIYKNFIEHFAELEIFDISAYRAIHFLYEHKKNIQKRFEFLETMDKDIIHHVVSLLVLLEPKVRPSADNDPGIGRLSVFFLTSSI